MYTVKYIEHIGAEPKSIQICAKTKYAAYAKAVEQLGSKAVAVWVYSVTYDNGSYRKFKTSQYTPY